MPLPNKTALKLSAARMTVGKKAPYWSRAIRALVPHELPGLGTMAVTERGVLCYDPAFVDSQPVKHLATVLVHESLHVVFHHHRRGRAIKNLDPKTWNMATDLEINDGLAASGWDMGQAILPSKYGLPDGLVAEDYYHRLIAQKAPPPDAPIPMGGWDGSGGGHAVPGEPQHVPQDPNAPTQTSNGAAAPGPLPMPQGKSQTDLDQLATQVAMAVKASGSERGRFRRWAEEATAPAKVRWQDKLSKTCRVIAARKRGYGKVSYARPNRKQAGVGYGEGSPILAGHYQPRPRVAVAVDTSGSMDEATLAEALGEVRRIFEAAGAPVDFIACDADVQVHTRLKDWREVKKNLAGGGGTDFRPVFHALATASNPADRPEVVVFATDGYGPAPERAPKGMETIWLITPGGRKAAEWGETIFLRDEDAA